MTGFRCSFLPVTIACLAAAGVVAAGSAAEPGGLSAPTGSTDNFRATLPIVVTNLGGANQILAVDFAGSAVVPRFGHATFHGTLFTLGIPGQTDPCFVSQGRGGPDPCFQDLGLELTGENGKQLTIEGRGDWSPPAPPPAAWTWFTRGGEWTGSGVYTTTLTADLLPDIGDTFLITLSGTLRHP
jgi:hypothetical protein